MERSSRKPVRTSLLAACAWVFLSLPAAPSTYGADENRQAPDRGPAQGPVLGVQRDEEKTTYSIGSSDRDRGKDDADRAWQMLDNVITHTRGARGKGSDNNR